MTSDSPLSTHQTASTIDSVVKVVPFADPDAASVALASIRSSGISGDLLEHLFGELRNRLAEGGNADRALRYLSRFIDASRNPQLLAALFQRDPQALDGLLGIFRFSPWLSECLIADPEAFDLIRMTEGRPIERDVLVDEIVSECSVATSITQAASSLRRHRRRETLRIAYGDLIHDQPLEQTCQQLSFLADAILSASLVAARNLMPRKKNERPGSDTPPVSLAILATGRYGGQEQDYSDDLEVLVLFEEASAGSPATLPSRDGAPAEFARQWAELFVAMLGASDALGPTYHLSQRLRPPETHVAASETGEVLRYFNLAGRTWHRHALTRVRVAAGDRTVGERFIASLQPWVYRRYLGAADLEGLRSLKRKLARRSDSEAAEEWHLEMLRRTTRDIESVTQFLQLLNGSDLSQVRVGSTLRAIASLEQTGCLTMRERTLLCEHYIALRRLMLRIELAGHARNLSAATESAADAAEMLSNVARTLGNGHSGSATDVHSLRQECLQRRQVCRHIIDHLVHDVFTDSEEIPFETEMVLDPEVDTSAVYANLRNHGFRDPAAALEQLLALAREPIRFLSDRRARHFLAGIAPRLLEEISLTPNPDQTLERLAAISDSLGGKAALWELFQTTPSALRLCTRLCASSPYLAGILTSNPGMLDELIDSLVLDRLPGAEELEASSIELCRSAEDIDPILRSFKNSAHLRIGVRDILGRDRIEATLRALSDTAEACLRRLAEDELESMCNRYGDPRAADNSDSGFVMVALGKLGGREPNYHSDLDILFLYQVDGQTRPRAGGRREGTTNHHFFNELAQRISKRVNHYGPAGRLYEMDAGIRLSNHRGTVAVTIDQFRQHFERDNAGSLWQRLALTSARCIFGSPPARRAVEEAIADVLAGREWSGEMAAEARQLRYSLERGAAAENLKRGPGGTMDVELVVQMLLVRHARLLEGRLGMGTLQGLELLRERGWIHVEHAQQLASSYRYLRSVEASLRQMDLPARHDLPTSADELRCLAFAMRETQSSTVVQKCEAFRESNRRLFETIIAELSGMATEIIS